MRAYIMGLCKKYIPSDKPARTSSEAGVASVVSREMTQRAPLLRCTRAGRAAAVQCAARKGAPRKKPELHAAILLLYRRLRTPTGASAAGTACMLS